MRRLIRGLLCLFWTVTFGLLATYAALLASTYLWPMDRPLAQGDVIVCLGAGINAQGDLGAGSQLRAAHCGALFEAGAAPVALFTGGPAAPGATSAAATMARHSGVPEDALLLEEASFSTLQNALFTLDQVDPNDRLILVTEAFHLPRAWASFRLMGARDLALSPAARIRPDGRGMLLRETLAIWFNGGRYLLWRATAPVLPDDTRTDLLH